MQSRCIPLVIAVWATLFSQICLAQRENDDDKKTGRFADKNRSSIQQEGLNTNPPVRFAIVGATVHRTPTSEPKIEMLLIDGSKIMAIGESLVLPPGTQTVDATGKHLYPGLIDAYTGLTYDLPKDKGTAYWNEKITPQLNVADELDLNALNPEKYRKSGFTAALVAPSKGIVQGQSCIVLLGNYQNQHSILKSNIAQHVRLTVDRGRGSGYPNSPMGAYALARQAMYDTRWYEEAWRVAAANSNVERPERNAALASLASAINRQQMVMIDTSNELFAIRASRFAREFGLKLTILGSGNEYRRLDDVVALGRPIVLPVDFPKAPDVSSPEMANDVSLENLMHWDHAPENPARLADSGVSFVFTTKGLKDKQDFLEQVRKAVKRGLSPEKAFAAMTIDTARLYGVDDLIGSLEKNKIANIMVTDGDLFGEKTKVVETWVDGVRHESEQEPLREVAGTWKLIATGFSNHSLLIEKNKNALSASIVSQSELEKADQTSDQEIQNDKRSDKKSSRKPGVTVKPIGLTGTRLTGAFRSDDFGHPGISLFSMILSTDQTANGQLNLPDGTTVPFSAQRIAETPVEKATEDKAVVDGITKSGESESPADRIGPVAAKNSNISASFPVNFPLGAFGRTELPSQPKSVLVKNVFIWTSGEPGNIENGAVLFGDGLIKSIHRANEKLPSADVVIDGTGAHLTPGIIDCHSHMATDSGVNESGQAITAEVRIGDMIDCDDITIYRQLAGGVTTANVLHGSANPIGGQNQVIKLRWGQNEAGMKFEHAPHGIKFALGENVKQSNWSDPSNRYPQTRMGVEQIMDDAFRAAIDYRKQWLEWNQNHEGLPPRKNLELDAITEIIEGTRWIHCHSYRQDEILALMRTLESHDITIGSFQHILEGYKVADAMATHGAMASAFADWWAYKYEVKDAIPYAGALMHRAGVVVSFNSDDAELGRHLNHEAVKAVRYGGVSEIEALKFVTLNPARQLRIDDRVGSIEVGKHADVVLWSGSPLSNLSIVQQTWIDGRKYFDRTEDSKTRTEVHQQRLTLIQKILESGEEMERPDVSRIDPAKLWPRHDEFCGHHHSEEDHWGEQEDAHE